MLKNFSQARMIPGSIWALGFVSLCMDASSELIHSLLPVFMVTTLGASMTSVGWIEGVAESLALVVKMCSGTLSDYLGKRKLLTMIGYGMAAFTKPLFPLAESIVTVIIARCLDRIGKGIRGAPRDALISDIAPPALRGTCFGLRQSLDTIGAVIGPLLAIAGMVLLAGNVRMVLWIAVIPAIMSFIILAFWVREPDILPKLKTKVPFRIRDMQQVGKPYWQLVTIAGCMTLARFSEAFLILRAQSVGVSFTLVPMIMVAMNVVYAGVAYPVGKRSDRVNKKHILIIGMLWLALADAVLASATTVGMVTLGVSLWGLHLAFTQGVLAAMVADTTPSALRGTAYGIFNLICGIALLAASVVAGMLWDHIGAIATFGAGAGLAVLTMIMLVWFRSPAKWAISSL